MASMRLEGRKEEKGSFWFNIHTCLVHQVLVAVRSLRERQTRSLSELFVKKQREEGEGERLMVERGNPHLGKADQSTDQCQAYPL